MMEENLRRALLLSASESLGVLRAADQPRAADLSRVLL
jgi:hypothetical protein